MGKKIHFLNWLLFFHPKGIILEQTMLYQNNENKLRPKKHVAPVCPQNFVQGKTTTRKIGQKIFATDNKTVKKNHLLQSQMCTLKELDSVITE